MTVTEKLHSRIREAMVQAGYTNPKTGEHSVRALTRELELNNSRVSRYLHQGSNMQLEARQAVADAIGLSLSDLDSLVAGREVETYSPPATANLLSYRERLLVNDLINLLAERHQQGEDGGEHEQGSASNTQADDSSATQDNYRLAAFEPSEDEQQVGRGAIGDDGA